MAKIKGGGLRGVKQGDDVGASQRLPLNFESQPFKPDPVFGGASSGKPFGNHERHALDSVAPF